MVQVIRDAAVNRLEITGGGGTGAFGGVAAGGVTATSGTVIFSNSNGVSFGLNGQTMTASHNGITSQSVQTQNMVSVLGSTGNISFANSNGITFGGNASTVTASHNGLTSQSNQAISAANGSFAFQTVSFSNANGISFSTSAGSAIVASHNGITSQTVQTQSNVQGISAGTQVGRTGDIVFSNSNGITFGMAGSNTVTASYTVPTQTNQTMGIYAVSNTTGASSSSTFDARSLSFQGAGVASVGMTNGSVVISVPSGGGAGDGGNVLAAGTQTANTTGTVLFNDANGITFGMNNSSVITASHNGLTSQSNQAVSAGNGSSTFQTLSFADSNGVSFSTAAGGIIATVRTDYQSSNPNYLTSQSNQAVSGSNGSFTFQTATFGNLNGMSFYTSNGSLVGSYTVPTVTNSSMTISDAATSGTLARLAFTNLNGVTLSLSTGAAGSHTIVGSHNGLTSQSNQAASAANGSFAFQTLSFSNVNGISFGTSAGSAITASHNGLTSQSNQAFSASGGSSAFQTLSFNNANGATFSNVGGAVQISYTVPTVPAQTNQTLGGYAVGNTTGQSSSSTFDARTLSIHGAGAASVGYSNGSIIISAPNAGAGNVTFSAGTTSNGLADIVFSNSNGVSFGLNGSTMTASVNAGGGNTQSTYYYPQDRLITAISGPSNGSISIQILNADANYSATRLGLLASLSAVSSNDARTFSFQYSHWCGIYTNNAGTLSSLSTASLATTLGTWSSNATSSVGSLRMLTMPFDINMSEGMYYIAHILYTRVVSTSTSSQTVAALNMTMHGASFLSANNYALIGEATRTSLNEYFTGQGLYGTTTNAIPATINMTGISATGTAPLRANLAFQLRA